MSRRDDTHHPLNPYRPSTDRAVAVDLMIEGGESRNHVAQLVTDRCGKTRSGVPVDGNKMMGNLIAELLADGWEIESSWKLIPPRALARARAT